MDAHACNSSRGSNTMKINLDHYAVVDEQAAFNALVDKFADAMKSKFGVKLKQGFSGWMGESDTDLIYTLSTAI